MSCQWREKVGLFVDDELQPQAQEEMSLHLSGCAECTAAAAEQMALKKAVRVAASSFTAPPDLHAAVYRQLHPRTRVSPWWKWAVAPLCVLLLAVVTYFAWPRRGADPMMAGLVDQHVTTLASSNPVDIVNSSHHVVKPWFQGKLSFTFNMPDVTGSSFELIGGREVFVNQRPGAQLLYQAGQHKISVFIFQARDKGTQSPVWNRDLSFTVSSWTAGGRQCYLVTDGSQPEAGRLVTMFQDANRS